MIQTQLQIKVDEVDEVDDEVAPAVDSIFMHNQIYITDGMMHLIMQICTHLQH